MKNFFVILPTLAGIMWGATGVFTRSLSAAGMDNATVLETRMLLGSLILLSGCLIMDRSLLKIKLKDLWIFVGGAFLGNFGLSYFYVESINRLSLGFAAVLLCIFPVFVMLLSAIFFKEKITPKKVGCMALAFAGCVLVSGVLEEGGAASWSWSGVLIGLLAAFCYALYSIFSKLAKEKNYSAVTITFYFMLMIAGVLIPFTDWELVGSYVSAAPAENSLFLLGHCLCAAVLPYIFYTYSMNYIDAGKASILASSEPAAAMVFGALLFAEIPSALSVGGMLLTVAAIVILSMPEKERKI